MLTGENWTNIFIAVIGILFITMAWLIKWNNNRLRQLKAECYNRIDELSMIYEQRVHNSEHEARENTMATVAREIHDNFNMRLILASMSLKHIDWANHCQTKEKVMDSIEQLNESIEGLTDLSRSLNSDFIQSMGLGGALEKEIDRITRANNFKIHFQVNGTPEFLPDIMETSIFRIFQESFNNIIKHSGTELVQVTLTFLSSNVYLLIMDHGVGFNHENPGNNPSTGTGLSNLQSRLKLINGTVKITSSPNKGTTLLFTIPYPPVN